MEHQEFKKIERQIKKEFEGGNKMNDIQEKAKNIGLIIPDLHEITNESTALAMMVTLENSMQFAIDDCKKQEANIKEVRNKIEGLKKLGRARLLDYMKSENIAELPAPLINRNATIGNRDSVDIDDISKVPKEFLLKPPLPKADKRKIQAHYDDTGLIVAGAEIVQRKYIVINVKHFDKNKIEDGEE